MDDFNQEILTTEVIHDMAWGNVEATTVLCNFILLKNANKTAEITFFLSNAAQRFLVNSSHTHLFSRTALRVKQTEEIIFAQNVFLY